MDAPHLPHAWECGYLFEETTRTLFCGDLFYTQGGDTIHRRRASWVREGFRKAMDYFAHASNGAALLDSLASSEPTTLACMHGSAWRGWGAVAPCACP